MTTNLARNSWLPILTTLDPDQVMIYEPELVIVPFMGLVARCPFDGSVMAIDPPGRVPYPELMNWSLVCDLCCYKVGLV